jgi:5-dehydro-2-deoxygluconokinase
MSLGFAGPLYILAFDHRGSFKKKMFGISGREPTAEESEQLRDAKRLVWEGLQEAVAGGAPAGAVGALVDEEMGAEIAREAKAAGIRLAMPVEGSGSAVFDFEYGDAFAEHIESFDPDFAKVLVRWNPDDDAGAKATQGARLKELSDWLHERNRKFLFELLVPASERQLMLVGGETPAYDAEVRPYLTLEAIAEIQDAGIEPDIWKIEGLDRRIDCELLARLIRRDGRDGVSAVVLGRGADDTKVAVWLEQGAGVAGYIGFAIGRTIWWHGVEGFKDGSLSREMAVASIASNYRRFIDIYQKAGS